MDYLIRITETDSLTPGDVIRRVGDGKEQQGCFVRRDESGGLIAGDVVDLVNFSFVTEVGMLRSGSDFEFFKHKHRFSTSSVAEAARAIITGWVLFKEHLDLQKSILSFVESVYSPEHVMELSRDARLQALFVPVQQKFKIGKFKEKIDWEKVRDQRFRDALEALVGGKHMTYLAFIPGEQSHKPVFYTIGTKPHQETNVSLQREPFAFKPTHGGHIKIVSDESDKVKRFIVDAGSNFIGVGSHTSLATAEMITNALHELFPQHEFTALAGRGAHGAQSY